MTSGPEPIDRHHTLGDYVVDLPNAVTFCGLLAGLGALGFVARARFGEALVTSEHEQCLTESH